MSALEFCLSKGCCVLLNFIKCFSIPSQLPKGINKCLYFALIEVHLCHTSNQLQLRKEGTQSQLLVKMTSVFAFQVKLCVWSALVLLHSGTELCLFEAEDDHDLPILQPLTLECWDCRCVPSSPLNLRDSRIWGYVMFGKNSFLKSIGPDIFLRTNLNMYFVISFMFCPTFSYLQFPDYNFLL